MYYKVAGTLDHRWSTLPWRGESYMILSKVAAKTASNVCSLRMVM